MIYDFYKNQYYNIYEIIRNFEDIDINSYNILIVLHKFTLRLMFSSKEAFLLPDVIFDVMTRLVSDNQGTMV